MDKKKSILNVSVSIGFKLILMVMSILVKRTLINSCGNDVNGLNALYLSIIGVLSVAELGLGSAIAFCMYKPIVNGDTEEVAGLYQLFRKSYAIIGGLIFAAGLLTMPFLHLLAKDYARTDVSMTQTFLLMLISVVMSYFFSAKISLINAYKNNYITTTITSCGQLLQYILQICVLHATNSFSWYLGCRIVAVAVQWCLTENVVNRQHRAVLGSKALIKPETRTVLNRSIRAMFMHNIGRVLVNTVDSLVISIFLGIVVLGEYSNYQTILSAVTHIIVLVFSSLTSVFGHLYAKKEPEIVERYCAAFHLLNFGIGMTFYLGYYAIADNIVEILFGKDLLVAQHISFVIALNGFVQFMRNSVLTFRDATGTFYNDRWKPLAEGVTNVILSVLLVRRYGVTGVLLATIFTNILICHVVEPFVLYRYAFYMSPIHYYIRNYGVIILFLIAQFVMGAVKFDAGSAWKELLMNGTISVGISLAACVVALLMNRSVCRQIKHHLRRN